MQESEPDELEPLEREIMTLQIQLESLKNESETFSVDQRNKVEQELKEKRGDAAALTGVWQTGERTEIRTNVRLTRVLCRKSSAGQDQRRHAWARSQRPIGRGTMTGPIRARLAPAVLYHSQAVTPASCAGVEANRDEESLLAMLHDRVTSNDILRMVAKAAGIPVQNLLKGERDKLVHVHCFLLLLIGG